MKQIEKKVTSKMKKMFGLKIVYDPKTRIMSYKAKWWLKYIPSFIIKKHI